MQQLWIGRLHKTRQFADETVNRQASALGKAIFFDERFSSNGTISCASCHQPEQYFTDGRKTAKGINKTSRNTPTIVGVSHNQWFFHDGRSDSLWSQALAPLESADEHGGNRAMYAHRVYNDPQLRQLYEQVFGLMPDISDSQRFPDNAGPVLNPYANNNWQKMSLPDQQTINRIFVSIGKSLAAYEVGIQPGPSRFDHYVAAVLAGDWQKAQKILTEEEAIGLRHFLSGGRCVLCHNGPMFSDQVFHNIGSIKMSDADYDLGRYEGARKVINSEFNCRSEFNTDNQYNCDELKYINLDKHETVAAFKTPGLRNVSKTAPYLHDGRYNTLKEVIRHYSEPMQAIVGSRDLLLPVDLNEQEVLQLESFLKALDSDTQAVNN